ATAETCADAVEKRAVRYLYESSYCIYTIRHRTNQAGSANAKIGVYCGRANERSKTAISLGMEWLVAVNLPKRLGFAGFALCQFRVLQLPADGSKRGGSHAGAAGVTHFLAEIRSADFYSSAHFI